jgi:hypothetical protein
MPVTEAVLKKSKRPASADSVLIQFAGPHGSVFYEIDMLFAAYNRCRNPQSRDPNDVNAAALANMSVECFLLHFRTIRDFLYPPEDAWTHKRRFDDVIAYDYWDGWRYTIADWKECSLDEKARIDKLLAHLSYSRPGLDHKWPHGAMFTQLMKAFGAFTDALPPQKKHWFNEVRHPQVLSANARD